MKKKTVGLNWWLAAGASCAAAASSTHAADAADYLVFSKGPVSLRPQLEVVEQFTDNVYFTGTDRISDFVTILSPGIRVVAGQDLPEENHFVLNYNLDQLLYAEESSQNATQHRFSTDLAYKWSRLSFEGTDRVEFLASALGSGLIQRGRDPVERLIVADLYRVDYTFGERMGVYGEIHHNSVDYEEGRGLFDSRTLRGTAGFEYIFSKDTRFFGEVYYGVTDLGENGNTIAELPGTSFVGGFIGARGNFTEKLRGKVKAGYEVSTFSGGSVSGDTAGEAPVVEAGVSYQFTDRSNISLTYNRRQFVSVQFVNSSYIADQVTLGASQILGSVGRLRLNSAITYQNLSYEPSPAFAKRNDSSYSFLAAASWYFQTWLSTRLQYSFENYTSDLPAVVDYHVNRITLSVAIGY
jgi:hypothetical protein